MASSFQSAFAKARSKRQAAPSLPPLGSYDPSVLLTYGQNKRTADNAQQQFDLGQAQAQDDLAIQLGRIGQQDANLTADHATATSNINQNYGNLAERQAEGALKANVESPGLLAQALARRMANRTQDQTQADTSFQRAQTDSSNRKADLALTLQRAYGSGTNGQPLGSNTLNLIQTKNDSLAGNLDLSGVAYQQAAANGYRFPTRKRKATIV